MNENRSDRTTLRERSSPDSMAAPKESFPGLRKSWSHWATTLLCSPAVTPSPTPAWFRAARKRYALIPTASIPSRLTS